MASGRLDKEQEIKDEMKTILALYEKGYAAFETTETRLKKERSSIPDKFVESDLKTDAYENHLMKAAQLKHDAKDLWKDSIALYESIDADVKYFAAQLKLWLANIFLQEHGFGEGTDKLREAYVDSDSNLRALRKLRGKLMSYRETGQHLTRAFENDETNCRHLLKNKYGSGGF